LRTRKCGGFDEPHQKEGSIRKERKSSNLGDGVVYITLLRR
jgi:hypothetical protein